MPAHIGHEERGIAPTLSLSERLRVQKNTKQLAVLVTRWHLHAHRALELTDKSLHKLLLALDVLRRPERLDDFLTVCECDKRGRSGMENAKYPQRIYLQEAAKALQNVDAQSIAKNTEVKSDIAEAIRLAQRHALKRFVRSKQGKTQG